MRLGSRAKTARNDGVEYNGVEYNGVEYNGVADNGVADNGVEDNDGGSVRRGGRSLSRSMRGNRIRPAAPLPKSMPRVGAQREHLRTIDRHIN